VLDDKVLDVEAVTEEDGEEHLRFAISPGVSRLSAR